MWKFCLLVRSYASWIHSSLQLSSLLLGLGNKTSPFTKFFVDVDGQIRLQGDIRVMVYDHDDVFESFFSGSENEELILWCCFDEIDLRYQLSALIYEKSITYQRRGQADVQKCLNACILQLSSPLISAFSLFYWDRECIKLIENKSTHRFMYLQICCFFTIHTGFVDVSEVSITYIVSPKNGNTRVACVCV